VKLQDQLKDSGFVIVASHVQNASDEDIISFLRSRKVNYTVTSFGKVPGDTGRGIPRAFLFNSTGSLVEQGHPATMKQKIVSLVESEPHWLAAGREYQHVGRIADALKKTKKYGTVLKALEREARKGGEAAEEAEYIQKRIVRFGQQKLDEAKKLEGEDAFLAQKLYSEVYDGWKGSEVGDAASDRLRELKRDRDFQTEFKASTYAHKILEQCEKLVPVQGKINLEYASNKKIAAQVRAAVPALKKKYPDSRAAAKISEQLEAYGFKDL
jgi:hypothetical protein